MWKTQHKSKDNIKNNMSPLKYTKSIVMAPIGNDQGNFQRIQLNNYNYVHTIQS